MKIELIVIGSSAGGLTVLTEILNTLPKEFHIPILIVQHQYPSEDDFFKTILQKKCKLPINEIELNSRIKSGNVFVCPSDYHVLIEDNGILTLDKSELVNYSRPCIDVTFFSASNVFKEKLMGIILTGASDDGCRGLKKIKDNGGFIIVQDPLTAESDYMPKKAIEIAKPDYVLSPSKIGEFLNDINK